MDTQAADTTENCPRRTDAGVTGLNHNHQRLELGANDPDKLSKNHDYVHNMSKNNSESVSDCVDSEMNDGKVVKNNDNTQMVSRLHQYVSWATHIMDDNIRLIQCGIYGIGALGLWRVLHSARAFTQFRSAGEIPQHFVSRHMTLRGTVTHVSTTYSPTTHSPTTPVPTTDASTVTHQSTTLTNHVGAIRKSVKASNIETVTASPNLDPVTASSAENVSSASSALEATTPTFAEAVLEEACPGKNGLELETERDSELTNTQYSTNPSTSTSGRTLDGASGVELHPLYLWVHHEPVFRVPFLTKRGPANPILLRLTSLEVGGAGERAVRSQLLHRNVRFQLWHRTHGGQVAHCAVWPNKIWRWRSLNEELVRRGEAIVAPIPTDFEDYSTPSHEDANHRSSHLVRYYYHRLLRAVLPGGTRHQHNASVTPGNSAALVVTENTGRENEAGVRRVTKQFVAFHNKLSQCESRAAGRRAGIWAWRADTLGHPDTRTLITRLWTRYRDIRNRDMH